MNDKFSKIGFILSIVGAAIGLGNAWKFPYMVGENGGSAFVVLYLFFAIVVGLSIFYAEMSMGKIAKTDVVAAFKKLAPSRSNLWGKAGIMVITGIFIASFYTVIIGWVMKYAILSLDDLPKTLDDSGKLFGNFVSNGAKEQILYFTIAFFAYFSVLSRGVKSGIEKINIWLIPTLAILLFLMLGYSMSMDSFDAAVKFMLVPDFSKINSASIFMALGLAFFTMCIGIGAVATYSASLDDNTNLFTSSLYVVALNILVSIVMGLIIFTFVFKFGAKPSQGVGLAFISLPTLFAKLGILGNVLSFIFFIALVFAGLTSAVSLVEPAIYYLSSSLKLSRLKSLVIVGLSVYILGVLSALSNITSYKSALTFFNKGFFDILDYLSSNIMLPIGGITTAIFVGYFMKFDTLRNLFVPYMGESIFKIWYFLLRYVAPICVFIVMVRGFL